MMSKRNDIDISYQANDIETTVNLSYMITMEGNVQTITCTVNTSRLNVPVWLQLRKFELKSILEDGSYAPLFIDNDNIKNVNSTLFIDKAYNSIMAQEKFVMAVEV